MYKKVIDSASGCATRPSLKKARERKCLVELTSTPSFKISKSKDAVPKRDKKTGVFTFKGFAKFKPNKSPSEVFKAGAFGGCYFGNIHSDVTDKTYVGAYKEYPKEWFTGINVKTMVASSAYDIDRNKYKVKSGNNLEFWQGKGWMQAQDPYGWFQWYCRFFMGRRSEDDRRQIDRWNKICGPKGRWKRFLIGKIVQKGVAFDDPVASPVTRQTLLHWAYEINEKDFEQYAKQVRKGKSTVYLSNKDMAHVHPNFAKKARGEHVEEEEEQETETKVVDYKRSSAGSKRYGLRRLQQVVTVKKQKVKHEHSEADVKVKKEE